MKKKVLALSVCLALCLGFTPAALAEEQPPAEFASPTVFTSPNGNYEVYANGCTIQIVAGTEEGHTNILCDINGDGAIGDEEYLQIGENAPTGAGYDLTQKPTFTWIYGGSKDTSLEGDTRIEMTGGSVLAILGGCNAESGKYAVSGDTNITVTGGKAETIYGGNALVNGSVNVTVGGTAQVSFLQGITEIRDYDGKTDSTTVNITVQDAALVRNLYSGGRDTGVKTASLTVTGGSVDFLNLGNTGSADVTVGGTARIGSEGDELGLPVGGHYGAANLTLTIAPAFAEGALVCVTMGDDLIGEEPVTLVESCDAASDALAYLRLFSEWADGTWAAEATENAIMAQYTPPEPPQPPVVDEAHKTITASDALILLIGAGGEEGSTAILYAATDASDEDIASPLTIGGATEYDLRGWTITAPNVYMAGGAADTVSAEQMVFTGGAADEVSADVLNIANSAVVGGGNGRGLIINGALEEGALQIMSTAEAMEELPGVGPFTGRVTLWLPDDFDQPEPMVFYAGLFLKQPDKTAVLSQFTLAGPGADKARLSYQEAFDENTGYYASAVSLENAPTPLNGNVAEFVPGTTYSISSKEQMERLAALVNSGNSGRNCFFILTADVDLEGGEEHQWPSIGRKGGEGNAPFAGVFDGGGHTVSGLYINRNEDVDKGLFAYVESGGGVRNLTVSGQAGGGDYAGGLVSHNKGRIENCVSNVSVSGGDSLGGLVSVNSSGGAILNCVNNGAVTGAGFVGGIVGSNSTGNSTVAACVNSGAVEGGSDVGGIVGLNFGAVTGCANNGAIRGTTEAGGIVGKLTASAGVERSCNTGAVSATGDFAGGIAGQMTPPSALVKDCFNTGDISARHHAGGLAGTASNGALIQNSWNSGGVSAAVYGAGGISGQLTPGGGARDCVSLGLSVSSGEGAGRVVGRTHSTVTLASNFARSDLSLTGGAVTGDTAKQDGRNGESITLSGDWQKTAFAGWDFDTVWNEGEGDSLPTLKGVETGPIALPRPISSGGGSGSNRPSASVDGEGGKIKIGNGTVAIIPDEGYQIAEITVNGKAVDIPENGILTGLKSRDRVKITFEKIPAAPLLTPDAFSDLDANAWYYVPVEKVLALGLMQGTGDGKFEPLRTMTRAEVWAVLARAAGEGGPSGTRAPAWYAAARQWAVENGVSDGTNPENAVTREQFVTMLWRWAGSPAPGNGLAAGDIGPDKGVAPWALEAVGWAVEQGIIAGEVTPARTITRAEVAAMVDRFGALKGEEKDG